jgi:hypothetical protein
MVVFFDALSVVICVRFVFWLKKKQNDFADRFADQTIEMNDFCIRLKNMPSNKWFNGDQQVLKAMLYDKI